MRPGDIDAARFVKKTVKKMINDAVILKDKIYLDYKEKVAAYVRNRIADPYAAEDVVSKIFLKVYRKLEYYDESRASLSTWIYSITRNTVIDYYKREKRKKFCLLMRLRKSKKSLTNCQRMKSF